MPAIADPISNALLFSSLLFSSLLLSVFSSLLFSSEAGKTPAFTKFYQAEKPLNLRSPHSPTVGAPNQNTPTYNSRASGVPLVQLLTGGCRSSGWKTKKKEG
jgi:hypothetical protein